MTIVDLPDEEKTNANGQALVYIGQEYIRTELVLERAKAKGVKHYRKVYADRQLEQETGYSEVFKPVMPPPLLAHSYASASVVTDVLVKKYVDAMPLYRQEQMWKRMGVALKRGTMANWVIQVADLYLRPFWKRIRSELLTQSTIHADETVMQVHKEKDRPDTSESRMWVYSSTKRADIQLRCFEYRESRSGKWARNFLEGFSGVLITDGYSGYNKVQDAERAGCWAHMRRKWLEATPEGVDAKTCKAAEGYAFCNRLFELEHQFEKLSAEERLVRRKEKSAPVLEAYWTWLNTISRPTGKLKDAVTHVYGAVEPETGDGCFWVMTRCDTESMNFFLEKLSEQYTDDYILLICDGAAWHKSTELIIPENIELFFIPPYTPEMNPIEQIWKEIRKRGFQNEVFDSLEAVIDRLCFTIKNLPAAVIKSITGRK